MALGQYIAGMGFSNVGLGVVHGMAHPLGAFYDTPHGIANAVLLPYVMEYNAEYTGEKFKYIAEAMGVDTSGMSQAEYRAAAVNAVKQLSKDVGIPENSNSKIFYLPSVFGGRFLLPEKNIYGIIHLK